MRKSKGLPNPQGAINVKRCDPGQPGATPPRLVTFVSEAEVERTC